VVPVARSAKAPWRGAAARRRRAPRAGHATRLLARAPPPARATEAQQSAALVARAPASARGRPEAPAEGAAVMMMRGAAPARRSAQVPTPTSFQSSGQAGRAAAAPERARVRARP